LDNSNILLRGCSLKINQFVIGVALYTGHETKVMLNSSHAKAKRSGLEDMMNKYFKVTFISQFVVTFLWYRFGNVVDCFMRYLMSRTTTIWATGVPAKPLCSTLSLVGALGS
jgi:magnesium-transporting ATPase (P-type)